jgi:hypothetical protein
LDCVGLLNVSRLDLFSAELADKVILWLFKSLVGQIRDVVKELPAEY